MQAVADRAFLPVKNLLEGGRHDGADAIRPPYPYGTEFVQQFMFAMKLCWFPLLLSTMAINYGAPGTQAGNVTAIILAAVAGTAITADLFTQTLLATHPEMSVIK